MLVKGVGCFNSSRYEAYVKEGKIIEEYNKRVRGISSVEVEKEVLSQICPDCSTQIPSDSNKLKCSRLLREHRKLCSEYPYSVVNMTNTRKLRSCQNNSKQEMIKLPAKLKKRPKRVKIY